MEIKNTKLKQAFEQIEKQELENLPEEEQVVRAFSENFTRQMEKLFDSTSVDSKASAKRRKIKWSVLVAAVLTVVITISMTAGASIWDLIDLSNVDSENYTRSEWVIDYSYTTGEGADEYVEVLYTGKPITIKYSLDTGMNSEFPERALVILVNGVRQTFDAVLGDNKYEDIDILRLERGLGTVQMVELTFEPNIGKKNEVLILEVSSFFDPDQNFYPKCEGINGIIGAHNDYDEDNMCDKCSVNIQEIPAGPPSLTFVNEAFAKIVMKKNAPKADEQVCESFSGYVESDLHQKIYDCFKYELPGSNGTEFYNEYNKLESMSAKFYRDIDENIVYDETGSILSDTIFRTTPKQDDKFTINLHGKSGEYRVAFYIGTEPQAVFDGADYVDVEIKDGKQVELNISLDTTKLEKENKFCIVYKSIGDSLFEYCWGHSRRICEGTIVVE